MPKAVLEIEAGGFRQYEKLVDEREEKSQLRIDDLKLGLQRSRLDRGPHLQGMWAILV